jgi:hypothetical protein
MDEYLYRIAYAEVKRGESSLSHILKKSSKVCVAIGGERKMNVAKNKHHVNHYGTWGG